jgi:hypothetical protein
MALWKVACSLLSRSPSMSEKRTSSGSLIPAAPASATTSGSGTIGPPRPRGNAHMRPCASMSK